MDAGGLITAVVVAALTGLTYLAYKHPDGYSKLPIGFWFWMFISITITWDVAIEISIAAIDKGVLVEKCNEVSQALKTLKPHPFALLAMVAFYFYHIFLLFVLPDMKRDDEK